MKWALRDRGFLPENDPVFHLDFAPLKRIEQLGEDLPRLVHERTFRDKCLDYLNEKIDWDEVSRKLDDPRIERLFQLFSYFASAFIHSPSLPVADRLPAPIAAPLERLGQILDRPPILAYASYCLHNWRRNDPNGPIALGNISLLQNFAAPSDGKQDEDWFILVHVDIEARAAGALRAVRAMHDAMDRDDAAAMTQLLQTTATSLHAMNATMLRMPEECRPEVYFKKVRPYIFGFTNVVFEGCADSSPRNYRGETGAQSSIVPTMLRALGLQHKNSMLIAHLQDMLNYMPKPHREFILSQRSVRNFVVKVGAPLTDLYDECLRELIAFRSRHFEYAVNYIEKKVDNPLGTGGTPYIPWLRQLIEESREHFLA